MSLENIYYELSQNMDDEYYVEFAEKEFLTVPVLIDIMLTENNSRAESILEKISEKNPWAVYTYFEYITDKIKECERFLCWNFWKIVANILPCDCRNLWSKVKNDYIKSLSSTQIAEFSIACDCAEKIIKAKPEDMEEILAVLVDATRREFKIADVVSLQCNEVAREKVGNLLEHLNNSNA